VRLFLTRSPTSARTSEFPFFPILIVQENVCNTCNKAVMVLIESLDQNISKAIKERWEVTSVAWRCTPWRGTSCLWSAIGESVLHTSVSGYAQSRGDQINIQRVGCLCPLYLALFHCAGDGIGGDMNTWCNKAWNEVQADFSTLILGRLHYRGACRVLAHRTHNTCRPAFGKSIELCMWHCSVNYAAGAIIKRWNCTSILSKTL